MRMMRIVEDIEFPEKDADIYRNIRSVERIDVRPGEERFVRTGLRLVLSEGETAEVFSLLSEDQYLVEETEELFVKVYNPNARNIMIYPGQVVGEVVCYKDEA